MKWDSYLGGVMLGLLHVLVLCLALVAGFAFVVRQTGEPASILVITYFISLPLLIQEILALMFGGDSRVPELGWILTGMLEVTGVVFLLFLFF